MLKVLAISSLFPSPAAPHHGVFVFNRLNAMASLEGVSVDVVNPVPSSLVHRVLPRYRDYQSVPAQWERGALPVHSPRYMALPGVGKGWEGKGLENALMRFARQLDMSSFDVIDVHWTYPDLPAAIALGKRYSLPVMVTLRGMEAFYGEPSTSSRARQVAQALSQVDGVVSLSEEMLEHADKIAGTGHRTSVVINGGDPAIFYPEQQSLAQRELGLDEEAYHVLGVGSLIHRKGFHRVIPALSDIAKRRRKRIVYHLVGGDNLEGNDGKTLSLLASEHAHDLFQVNFAGKSSQDALRTWYSAVNLFVLSSLGEGSPNVLTEALCCGTPTLAVDVGSSRTMMQQSPVPFNRVVPNDDAQLMDGLADMLRSTAMFPNDVARTRNGRAQGEFDWQWCALRHVDALRRVVSGRE